MTTLVLEVPLSPDSQVFTITLNGADYRMRFLWCDPAQAWTFDIMDADGNPIAMGLPLVTGVDLLGQLDYLGIGGSLVAQTDHDADAVPTVDNLGLTGRLYFVTQE
jgi:hypothetical protein